MKSYVFTILVRFRIVIMKNLGHFDVFPNKVAGAVLRGCCKPWLPVGLVPLAFAAAAARARAEAAVDATWLLAIVAGAAAGGVGGTGGAAGADGMRKPIRLPHFL